MSERGREFVSSRRQDIKITESFPQNPLKCQAKKATVSSLYLDFTLEFHLSHIAERAPKLPTLTKYRRTSGSPRAEPGAPSSSPFDFAALRSGRPLENPLCSGPIPSECPRPEAVARVEGSEDTCIRQRWETLTPCERGSAGILYITRRKHAMALLHTPRHFALVSQA
jgi:hypothetical protein